MKKIINLVDKPITIITDSGNIVIESSGSISMRSKYKVVESVSMNGIIVPIVKSLVSIWGIPDEREDTVVIVPAHIYEALAPHRKDVVSVNSVVKSPIDGSVFGCRSIGRRETISLNNKKISYDKDSK